MPMLGLSLALALAWRSAPAQAQDADPTKLKAAYLLNFIKATTWPAGTFTTEQSPVEVVVIGDGGFDDIFRALTARQVVGSRRITVTAAPTPSADYRRFTEALEHAHVLYVGPSASSQVQRVLAAARGRPLLVVGDVDDFARDGGMLGLDIEGSRIVFDAHVAAIREAKLEVSSKVLRLARRVYREAP